MAYLPGYQDEAGSAGATIAPSGAATTTTATRVCRRGVPVGSNSSTVGAVAVQADAANACAGKARARSATASSGVA
jgi:hypothetical protein